MRFALTQGEFKRKVILHLKMQVLHVAIDYTIKPLQSKKYKPHRMFAMFKMQSDLSNFKYLTLAIRLPVSTKAQNNVSIWEAFSLSVAFPPRAGPKPHSSGSLQGH